MAEETYGHTPAKKMFDQKDVYGIGPDEERRSHQPIRLGIIGGGGVAQSKHIPAITRLRTIWEPVELCAVSSLDEQSGRKIEKIVGCRWYRDAAQMLDKEKLDGAIVCSPDDLHVEHGTACLDAGLHVLVEKPISRSLVAAQKMCARADELGAVLMTGSNKRMSPPYRRAQRFVTDGPVSSPAMLVGKFNLGYDYVELLEGGTIHLFDLSRFFMGDVQSVSAVGVNKYRSTRPPYPIDNAIITLRFASGSIGVLYTSSTALSLKPWERVEIYGNNAWLAVEDQSELILYDSEEGPAKSWRPLFPHTLVFDEEFGGFMSQIENFLQAIRRKETPIATGWDGYRAFELVVAAHLSMHRGESIALPLDPAEADADYMAALKAQT